MLLIDKLNHNYFPKIKMYPAILEYFALSKEHSKTATILHKGRQKSERLCPASATPSRSAGATESAAKPRADPSPSTSTPPAPWRCPGAWLARFQQCGPPPPQHTSPGMLGPGGGSPVCCPSRAPPRGPGRAPIEAGVGPAPAAAGPMVVADSVEPLPGLPRRRRAPVPCGGYSTTAAGPRSAPAHPPPGGAAPAARRSALPPRPPPLPAASRWF